MKGNLTTQPLAELIREIAVKGISGTLRLERERAQMAVYFERGQVVYAASNVKTLRLEDYLKRRNLLSEQQAERVPKKLPDLELAANLVASRVVRQKEMDVLLSLLVSDILRVLLLWTEGNWEFDDRSRLAKSTRIPLDVATLLREAAQRLPFSFVGQRLRNASEILTRVTEVSGTSNLQNAESFILSRLDKPLSLNDLITVSGLPEAEARRFIYGLALSGLLEREYWQNAFRTDGSKGGKDQAPVYTTPALAGSSEHSINWLAAKVENEELDQFLRRLRHATNHYEVIELPPTADADEIKEAYYAMARRYHPDRFHLKSGTKLHSDISSAFARVTQAYETLTDANARRAYDQGLERAGAFSRKEDGARRIVDDDSDVVQEGAAEEYGRAESNFREGVAALQQGRFEAAINFLAAAVRFDPQQARYHAHYGKALAANESTRRLAENELQAAVKLEPQNVTFHTMLAEFYFQLKFHRRAQGELERALALDPKNATAHALLRKLERSRKVG